MAHDPHAFPVVVSNACADAAVELFGLGSRGAAREWVLEVIADRGEVVERLPEEFGRRRSPSGYFLVAESLLALPLAAGKDRDGGPVWVATQCLGVPQSDVVDPFALVGNQLLEQVSFTVHAIQRFQERAGGVPDAVVARRQLVDLLVQDVYASRSAPRWWRSASPALFYLVAGSGDEICLPCRGGDGVRPFTATTFMHRAADLFAVPEQDLWLRCRVDPERFPSGGSAERRLLRLLGKGARLSWHKPKYVPFEVRAKWWLLLSPGLAAPVAWEPEDPARPLVVLGLCDDRTWWRRLFGR
ncbi:hypothetical protein ACWEKT_18810 [Nocardia takedensis]